MSSKYTNRLIKESSPYLRQHAHNPVDWYPWGEEALQRAKKEDKPILVSIGYSACHWCHVMEHESFEDTEVADYMNAHFINIKIDREERPDLDHVYMDAVQAIAGGGGWPLNVFLTTDTKPFYGGTYFPPQKAFNRPSWKEILVFITDAWENRKTAILEQADVLVEHLQASGNRLLKELSFDPGGGDEQFTVVDVDTITENILKQADISHGGFGAAPKFPQTFTVQYLLMYGHFFKQEKALAHALLSLQKMLDGGIYDHVAGGMARYSTDKEWLAPHFEKMLYDNALLVSVLCDAYAITKKEFLRENIQKTLQFLIREMKHPQGGFYAAMDADTEGVEGKFYVWDMQEVAEVTGSDAALCCEWYGVTESGNWEGKNILHVHTTVERFAAEKHLTVAALQAKIQSWNSRLEARRNARVRPAIDDKILLGWNALLLTAFCKASAALGDAVYKHEAIALFDFITSRFEQKEGGLYHTYKVGEAKHPAFLDDYACLIQASIHLQEITLNERYLLQAKDWTDYVLTQFEDADTGLFGFTHKDQRDILVRKTEIYDGAVPSGNSVMADNLIYLSIVFDKKEWGEKAAHMISRLREVIIKYPTSFSVWAGILLKQVIGIHEIVVTGKHIGNTTEKILEMYLPNKVFQGGGDASDLPLLRDKAVGETALIYLCKQYACLLPVTTVEDFRNQLK
jgi:hypothetical protein